MYIAVDGSKGETIMTGLGISNELLSTRSHVMGWVDSVECSSEGAPTPTRGLASKILLRGQGIPRAQH